MKQIKVIIVDDEIAASDLLSNILIDNYPELKVMSVCQDINNAVKNINNMKPDLLFLDVDLKEGNGFDILEQVNYKNFDVVFTTSYTEFAVLAFEFSALHYLLKPITKEKTDIAIKRFKEKNSIPIQNEQITNLKTLLNNKNRKILISTGKGLELFDIDDIIRCEADGNYSNIYFRNKKHILVCKTLQTLESSLADFNFFRINRKYLINIECIVSYNRGKYPTIKLIDGFETTITEHNKHKFREILENHIAKVL